MTTTTTETDRKPRRSFAGENNPSAVYTAAQVAQAKLELIEAECDVVLAPGELDRIAALTGIRRDSLVRIAQGTAWAHVQPATRKGDNE